MKNIFITPNYVGELYLIDKLKKNGHNNINLEKLITSYINKYYLNYLLNNTSDYDNIYKKINKLIHYSNKYNIFLNTTCEICNYQEKPKHSIKFKGYLKHINGNYKYVIYIEPALATNFEIYYICQHLIMELNNAINLYIDNNKNLVDINNINNINVFDLNINDIKINFVFNMKDNSNTLQNIKIAKAMYKILNTCFNNEIENIYVYNFGFFMKFFTKLFSSTFNDKIIVVDNNPFLE
jgi:hypothetical protein